MSENNFEGANFRRNADNRLSKIIIAAICGAVLITFIMAGCFLTALIMILDAIPFHHIF